MSSCARNHWKCMKNIIWIEHQPTDRQNRRPHKSKHISVRLLTLKDTKNGDVRGHLTQTAGSEDLRSIVMPQPPKHVQPMMVTDKVITNVLCRGAVTNSICNGFYCNDEHVMFERHRWCTAAAEEQVDSPVAEKLVTTCDFL